MQVDCIALMRLPLGNGYGVILRKEEVEPPSGLLQIRPQEKAAIAEACGIEAGPAKLQTRLRFNLRDTGQLEALAEQFMTANLPNSTANSIKRILISDFMNAGIGRREADGCNTRPVGFGRTVIGQVTFLICYVDVVPSPDAARVMKVIAERRTTRLRIITLDQIRTGRRLEGRRFSELASMLLKKPVTP